MHEGFLEELRTVQAKIVLELFRNGGRERPVYVTGHSQGGAEAAEEGDQEALRSFLPSAEAHL